MGRGNLGEDCKLGNGLVATIGGVSEDVSKNCVDDVG